MKFCVSTTAINAYCSCCMHTIIAVFTSHVLSYDASLYCKVLRCRPHLLACTLVQNVIITTYTIIIYGLPFCRFINFRYLNATRLFCTLHFYLFIFREYIFLFSSSHHYNLSILSPALVLSTNKIYPLY